VVRDLEARGEALEEFFQLFLKAIEHLCELAVGLCIAAGTLEALGRMVIGRDYRTFARMEHVWRRYAGWILLSLELALAADIVGTVIAPSWQAIGQLGAIAAIRTALNYFMERDLKEAREAERREAAESRPGA
jgi:uncharacterized membrane protein